MRNNIVLAILVLLLATLACGVTAPQNHALAELPLISTAILSKPSRLELSAAKPLALLPPQKEVVTIAGSWNVRVAPHHEAQTIGILTDCDITVIERIISPDMSVWVLLDNGGYINARSIE